MRQNAADGLAIASDGTGSKSRGHQSKLDGDASHDAGGERNARGKQDGARRNRQHLRLEGEHAEREARQARPPAWSRPTTRELPERAQVHSPARRAEVAEKPERPPAAARRTRGHPAARAPCNEEGAGARYRRRRDHRPADESRQVRKRPQRRQQHRKHRRVYGEIQQSLGPGHLAGQLAGVGRPVVQAGEHDRWPPAGPKHKTARSRCPSACRSGPAGLTSPRPRWLNSRGQVPGPGPPGVCRVAAEVRPSSGAFCIIAVTIDSPHHEGWPMARPQCRFYSNLMHRRCLPSGEQ